MNRKMRRQIKFYKPTKYTNIMKNDNGDIIAYLHPTRGYKGNKKAIMNFKLNNKGK